MESGDQLETNTTSKALFEKKYKILRNTLRSIKRDDFLLGLIQTLRNDEDMPFEDFAKGKPMPWTLLTVFKLACQYCGTNADAKKADYNLFVKAYNMAYDLEGDYTVALLHEGLHGFFLHLSHQQFWHQREIVRSSFARLDYFFCTDEATKQYDPWHKKQFGIPIKSFAILLVATWAVFKINKRISTNLINSLSQIEQDHQSLFAFINAASVGIDDVESFVRNRASPVTSYFLQFGEISPFLFAPILRATDTQHFLLSLRLLERSIHTLLFERVKQSGNEAVIRSFANKFEEYINELLNFADLSPWRHSEIEDAFPGKTTDFLFQCGTKTIFIEAKSIRLSPIAIANPTPDVLIRDIKDSVCKAILQCYELASELNHRCGSIDPHLIIVTYDDVYFGDPLHTWHNLFRDYFSSANVNLQIEDIISPSKIFILGIQEFEEICASSLGPAWFGNLLDEAIASNAIPDKVKHCLSMHLAKSDRRRTIPLVEKHFSSMFSRITDKVQPH